MTKTQKTVGAAILLAIVIGTGFLLAWSAGPSYQGRSVSKWFYQAGNFDSPPDPEVDRQAFRTMGSKAVPFLVRRLEAAPSTQVKGWLGSVSHTASEIYRQRKEMWQGRAAYLLGEIGPAAKAAETNLIQAAATGNWSLRGDATVALMKIRQQPPDPLIKKLEDTSDWKAWYENAMMVGSFGSRAEPAVPIFLAALQHTNNIVQAHALIALGMIAQRPNDCIPAIVPFLRSPSVSDRQKAMHALVGFGTNAVVAKGAIQSATTDSDPWVRKWANHAMKLFGEPGGTKVGEKPAEQGAPPEK